MSQSPEVVSQALESGKMNFVVSCKSLRFVWRTFALLLLLALPGFAQAARQCPDGSTAGSANECPNPVEQEENDSKYIGGSVPKTMVVGQSYAASITFQNTGWKTWTPQEAYRLGSQEPTDNSTWGTGRVELASSVTSGANTTFNFTVRAPLTSGTTLFQWRMVRDGVAWFGGPSYPVDINVLPSIIKGGIDGLSSAAISGWACSTNLTQPVDVHLYLDGTGGTGNFIGAKTANLPSEAEVASICGTSASNYRFSFPIDENFILQNGGKVIFIHGISPVGAAHDTIAGSGNLRVPAIDRSSAFVGQSVPATMTAGQPYPVEVTFRNTGNVTWRRSSNYRLGAFNQSNNGTWGTGRVELPDDVPPGQSVRIAFTAVPQVSGALNFQWKLLQEGVTWFGEASSNQVVTVQAVNQPPSVSLTEPANGKMLYAPGTVTLRANANDPEGGLASVSFYSNDALVGTVGSAPYQVTLNDLAVGSYRFKAVASDVNGLTAESGQVAIAVKVPQGPARAARSYVYDANQQLCKVIEPESGSTVMAYDAAGNVIWSASGLDLPSTTSCDLDAAAASGRQVVRTYDSRNRLKTLQFPDKNGNQDWSYTPDGLPAQVTTLNDAGGSSFVNVYNYNKRRMMTSESSGQTGWYNWTIGYGYDANAALANQTYPTGLVIDYAPNALGQPTAVLDQAGTIYATGIDYYPNGAARQFTYGNGVSHSLVLNGRQMPQQVRDNNVASFEYQYDANGNVTTIYDQQRGVGYNRHMGYDGLDRLVEAGSGQFGGDSWNRYTYDVLDNILSAQLAGVSEKNYWYDAKNRLTNVVSNAGATTVGLSYDPQGNLNNKNGQAFTFDYGNRLRNVTGKESYAYDAYGRRTVAGGPTTLTPQIYTQAGQLFYTEASGKGGVEYIYLNGSLLATRNAGAIKFQHTDALGSPIAVTDAAGQVVERTDYQPYGSPIGKTVDGIGYTGHAMDGATGLTYMQQRYYDQELGRFVSVDPMAADSVFSANFNRYWYASNNPYRFTDPDGRSFVVPWGAVSEIAATRAAQAGIASQLDSPLPGPGDFIGAVIIVGAVGEIGHKIYQANSSPEGKESSGPRTLAPGEHAVDSVPARGPERDFTPEERKKVNEIGRETGCHTCGTTDPGTKGGNFIPDHQPPTKANPNGEPQRLYPQCLSCSRQQGGEVRQYKPPPERI
ncbi:RHS repeat domain-containing protein [Xanthomonas fragariae]|uniref:RHS repeat domain-containing protein n=1 Tax=Xanthomonas fragariae TaxID=48664 RepID=UPI0022A9FE60|nr:RHS repeat-associated core domain-containing protein [Xanthomonas fragariae]WAT15827.1 Ig-like domain-containing protein [Xanthomonas fragariae]